MQNERFYICARVSSLAIIALLLVIITSGCGGSGGTPVLPDPVESEPEIVLPPAPPGAIVTAYRFQLTNTTIKSGGGAIYEYLPYGQKIIDIYDNPVKLRFRLESQIGGQWFLNAGADEYRFDIRNAGIESGEFAPQLTSLPPHDEAFSSTVIWWVERAKGSGLLSFVAEAHSAEGILCSLHFGLYLHGDGDDEDDPLPPPVENHPPTIDWWLPFDSPVILTVGDPIQEFYVSGEDVDGNDLEAWWTLGNEPPIISSGFFNFNPTLAGNWVLKVRLYDGEDYSQWKSWTIEVHPEDDPSPPPNNDLYPIPSDGNIIAYYGNMGMQSIQLEVVSGEINSIGFILWELYSSPSGAMTVPLGDHPKLKCEFYYEGSGIYTVWASPYESKISYQNNSSPIGEQAIFIITVEDS